MIVSPEQRDSLHIMSGLAARAFMLAGYDMSPDNPIDAALENGFIHVHETEEG